MKLAVVALTLSTLGACSDPLVKDYAVAAVELPQTTADATAFGVDLDGDGTIDNQLGVIFSALVSTHDATTHAADMVASGAITSTLETVDGAPHYLGNPSGMDNIALPIFADADPLLLPLEHVVIDIDGDTALVRGGIPIEAARTAAYAGVAQMMHDNPAGHLAFARVLDTDHDGVITMDELANSSLLSAFLVADLHDAQQLSIGFRVTLGEHVGVMAMDPCHDRVVDGDETAVDCGGSCAPCPPAAPTCTDGVRDQFESGVDCGAACPPCGSGEPCAVSTDCASGTCNGAGPAGVGSCAP